MKRFVANSYTSFKTHPGLLRPASSPFLDSQLEGPSLSMAATGRSTWARVPAAAAASSPFESKSHIPAPTLIVGWPLNSGQPLLGSESAVVNRG